MTSERLFPWTPELIDRAYAMYEQGIGPTAISKEIGVTKNAVIGKIHRERIKRGGHTPSARGPLKEPRARPSYAFHTAKPTLAPVKIRSDEGQAPNVVFPFVTKGTGMECGIVDLCGCKWPVEARSDVIGGQLFCNAPRPLNQPYCETHRKASVSSTRSWTAAEDDMIRKEWCLSRGRDYLAQVLKRDKRIVSVRAHQLGLKGMK
jgi:hypothetical protein